MEQPQPNLTAAGNGEPAAADAPLKVLVVDDSLAMRALVLGCLRRWNYDTLEAKDGAEAWEIFEDAQPPLVLTDWLMPNVDGLELIRRIRASEVPSYVYIILLTAKSDKEDLVAAMEAGADDFLVKPVVQDELRVRVREGERIIRLQRRLAEQNRTLRETQAALVQREKLASLGQMAAGMAHEINNPIAYVVNNVAVLERSFKSMVEVLQQYRSTRDTLAQVQPELAGRLEEVEQQEDVAWIEESVPRLLKASREGLVRVRDIIKNLRDFARLDQAAFDDVDLNAALESTLEVLRHELSKKDIRVEKQFEPRLTLACHPAKMHQVFLNLLRNAIWASHEGGTIEIRTRRQADKILVEIEDHGVGIEPKYRARIFEPFFTTKPVGQGTGLGLAISYGVVSEHGGAIEVESEPGQGSIFRVRLPAGQATESIAD